MACPFFIPAEHHPSPLWPYRYRLSLGDGFTGRCSVCPGHTCDDETLRTQCNMGYATCPYLPVERPFDSVRFLVTSRGDSVLRLQFACERAHLPVRVGTLRYDQALMTWLDEPDPQLIHLANAAIRAWVRRSTVPSESHDRSELDVKIATD